MAKFFGYSTIDRTRKFRLEDYELIKRDMLNNLLIKQGELPGRPTVGTKLWDYLFDSLTESTLKKVGAEIKITVEKDPRIKVDKLNYFVRDAGLLIEMTVSVVTSSEQQLLNLFLNTDNSTATLL